MIFGFGVGLLGFRLFSCFVFLLFYVLLRLVVTSFIVVLFAVVAACCLGLLSLACACS